MALPQTLLLSVFSGGGRKSRYGDFVVVTLPAGAFAATAQEYSMAQRWAGSRASCGNSQRDRTAFTDRFETLLARSGSGIATKGSRPVLQNIVKGLTQMGLQMNEWSVPRNIDESVEIARRKPAA